MYKLFYKNSANETVDFTSIIIQDMSDIFSHAWEHEKLYERIYGFKKNVQKIVLQVCVTGSAAKQRLDKILDIIEKDIISNSLGRLHCGDWYIDGYFSGCKLKEYFRCSNTIKFTMTFVTDKSCWTREYRYTYRMNDLKAQERGLGYSYGYPYDFLSSITTQNLYNTAFSESNFILTIYGPVVNPSVTISGNTYQINTEVLVNEYLTINTLNKTIVKTNAKGVKSNEYAKRSLDDYIFKKIPAGMNTVSSPNCNFDIILFEERSEPKWT